MEELIFTGNEEGEELRHLLLENGSDEDFNSRIINVNYFNQNLCIIICFITILILVTPKYLFKKSQIEKYNECQWFIDGKSYFEDLFQKLMEANNSIYIRLVVKP